MKYNINILVLLIFCFSNSNCQDNSDATKIVFDYNRQCQVMHSFGASDCWRTQFIGKWPLEKREKMADLLFGQNFDKAGNPVGIGLSMWRFNIGSGSHEAGDAGGIQSDWRRTECFLDAEGNWDWSKQEGQQWFLKAARERGVPYTLGFSISAPTFMSKNGMARASEANKYANIKEDKYEDYARYMATVCKHLGLDYVSPINEPQWEWIRPNQEGMQATNEECCRLIKYLDKELTDMNASTKIVFGEAADIRYLYREKTDKPDRDNQINEMFSSSGKHAISNLPSVASIVSGHSYWSTWPLDTLVQTRKDLHKALKERLPQNFTYWQTEYCPMEKNDDNPNGGGHRDLGMNTALYVSRIIHHDLTLANASSWQYWTAFTEWDYKDGLIYIDDNIKQSGANSQKDPMVETCKTDGAFRTSKLFWAIGNYSLFVRPGMRRIDKKNKSEDLVEEAKTFMSSAYIDERKNNAVVVFTNNTDSVYSIKLEFDNMPKKIRIKKFRMYQTSEQDDLAFKGIVSGNIRIPGKSIVTLISQ